MKLKKYFRLSQRGTGHVEAFVALAVIAVIAVAGVYVSKHNEGHALTPGSITPAYTNGPIWTGDDFINPDGSNVTSVSLPPSGNYEYDNASPDGSQIAFFENPAFTDIYNAPSTGSTSGQQIGTLPANSRPEFPPVWSPNGKLLAIPYNKVGTLHTDVMIVAADGSTQYQVSNLTNANFSNVGWLPSSNTLVYMPLSAAKAPPKDSSICEINIDGSGKHCTQITGDGVAWHNNIPEIAVSPNGQEVLVLAYNFPGGSSEAPSADIYSLNIDGKGLTKLTNESTGDQVLAFQWSPDQTQISYILTAGPGSGSGLYIMDANGSNNRLISSTVYYPDSLTWTYASKS